MSGVRSRKKMLRSEECKYSEERKSRKFDEWNDVEVIVIKIPETTTVITTVIITVTTINNSKQQNQQQ